MSAPTPDRVAQLLAALEVELENAKMLRVELEAQEETRKAETQPAPELQLVRVHSHKRI